MTLLNRAPTLEASLSVRGLMRFLCSIACLALAMSAIGQNFALHYNGKQESIIPDCAPLDMKQLTFECWVRPDGNTPGQYFRYLASKNYGNEGWGVVFDMGYQIHGTWSGLSPKPLAINHWTHVAYVCGDKFCKMYLNGHLVSSEPVGEPLKPSTFQLCIGCSSFFGEPGHQLTNFSGDIDEIRLWNRARTGGQIRATMRRTLRGNERGLVVYLPFDEGHGDMASNKAGKTPGLRLGRSFRPDEWDPTWTSAPALRKLR